MAGTLEAIRLVRRELEPRDVPVIGFAGAPFTLASYAIEGGTSRDFTKTKAFMLSEPAAWKRLLGKLVTVQADYLLAQARGGRAGAAGVRLVGRPRARARGLPPLRRAAQPRALRARLRAAGVPGDQLLARGERVPRGCGRVRRRRRRARLDAAARRGVGARRLRAAGAGEPRSGVAARALAGAPLPDRRRARARRWPARPRLQRRARARPADAGRQRAPARRARARADRRRERSARRRPRHGVRRPGVARGDPRLPRGHPPRATDAARSPRRDHRELPRDRRELAAPRGHHGARSTPSAAELGDEYRCYLGMRHWAPWIEEVVGEMVDDGIDARGEPRPRAALQRALGRALPAEGRRRARALPRADRLRARPELPRRAGARRGVRARAWRKGSRAGPRPSASACTSSSARTAFPERVLASGDPYGEQCLETARLVAERAGLADERWSWAYQSAGRTPEPWAGPISASTSRRSRRRACATSSRVPVGFVSDHVELLFDVDQRGARRSRRSSACGSSARLR